MAFLKGNTYVDGNLIVDGDITVGSLSSKGVAFTQLINPQDNYVALTTSSGNLTPSTIRETLSAGGTATYSLNNISAVTTNNSPLTINNRVFFVGFFVLFCLSLLPRWHFLVAGFLFCLFVLFFAILQHIEFLG